MTGQTSLTEEFTSQILRRVGPAAPEVPVGRQPIHVVYGGAHLFKAGTIAKLGKIATQSFQTYAPDAASLTEVFGIESATAGDVHALVIKKLATEPVEDFRIDFEDGYGPRSDEEEDGHAISAADETAKAIDQAGIPPFCGIRIKSLSPVTARRAIRTLDLYLTRLRRLPANFVVTLSKVDSPEQVSALADVLHDLEGKLGIERGFISVELMVETPRSIISADGRAALPALVAAGRGRVRSAHFGAYDYAAACGIASMGDEMRSAASDFARNVMQVSLAGTGVNLSDGATSILPIAPHRGDDLSDDQRGENRDVVTRAWRLHYDICRRSLANGFYQGWDLHPGQIPARYASVYSYFLEHTDAAAERLKNFVNAGAKATLVGDAFDDAATGQGLLNFFVRAINCGAITEAEAAARTGIAVDSIRSGSFDRIVLEKQ